MAIIPALYGLATLFMLPTPGSSLQVTDVCACIKCTRERVVSITTSQENDCQILSPHAGHLVCTDRNTLELGTKTGGGPLWPLLSVPAKKTAAHAGSLAVAP